MVLNIDLASSEALYQQIRTQIVQAVATGELCPGEQLPSVRALARDLGINMHTVNKAYAVLRDEGSVVLRGRSGAYVADAARSISPARASEEQRRLVQSLTRLAIEYRARGGSHEDFVALATAQADATFGVNREE